MSEDSSSSAMSASVDNAAKQQNLVATNKPKRKSSGSKTRRSASNRQTSNKPKLSAVQRLRGQNSCREDVLAQDFGMLNLSDKGKEVTQTGLSYDERMSEHLCLWDKNYPEKPERFTVSLDRCRYYKLVDRCVYIPCRSATDSELMVQHDHELIDLVRGTKNEINSEHLERLSSRFDAIYFHPSTYDLALLAAGSTIDVVTNVATGKMKNAMGLIRPPGHHAMKNEPCGYCYFNNVAIAAKHAVDNLGVKRVLIVDWDVHHGQATQQMFYNDPRVLYFSIHRYEHGDFWPNLRESNFDYTGEGPGKGYNFNVPLNQIGLGNAEYLAIFHQLLLPVAYEFCPELILVSAGYDAALGCFEGCMEVTPACYAHLVSHLMSLADGKVCVILEGGYCLKSLSEGVALTLRTLLGDPCPLIGSVGPPCLSLVDTILNVISVHRQFWRCFQYQGVFSQYEEEVPPELKRRRHVPEIKFFGNLDKPVLYPTRDCYPVQSADEISELDERLDFLIKTTSLDVPLKRTCLVYDERMRLHKNFTESGHPERPERLDVIYTLLKELKILDKCHVLQSRNATVEELSMFHSKLHIEAMKETESMKQRELNKYQEQFQSIYLCQDSYSSALLSAGSLFQVLEEVVTGKALNGIAIIRPPGHHAEKENPCGFCIFNNVALAAQLALDKFGVQRILIVDWDVHHGNGIQHAFESDPRVLYTSLHRYDKGSFFPCSADANYDKVGKEKGLGFNINIPWNKGGISDGDYISAFLHVILPIAYQFNPELVLVSAGFDAARGDPLGGCSLSAQVYGHLTHLLTPLANGRIILALEGGYNLAVLCAAVAHCAKVLLGDSCSKLATGLRPCSSAVTSILNVLNTQKKYWSTLQFQVDLPHSVDGGLNDADLSPTTLSSASEKSTLASTSNTSLDSITSAIKELSLSEAEASSSRISPPRVPGTGNMPQTVYAVTPIKWCPHLESVQPLPDTGINIDAPCVGCKDKTENWICLTCYQVHCGRFVNQDMLLHNHSTGHCVVLSFADLSVWCYGCEAYLENQALTPVLAVVHRQKFGEELPAPVVSLEM